MVLTWQNLILTSKYILTSSQSVTAVCAWAMERMFGVLIDAGGFTQCKRKASTRLREDLELLPLIRGPFSVLPSHNLSPAASALLPGDRLPAPERGAVCSMYYIAPEK